MGTNRERRSPNLYKFTREWMTQHNGVLLLSYDSNGHYVEVWSLSKMFYMIDADFRWCDGIKLHSDCPTWIDLLSKVTQSV